MRDRKHERSSAGLKPRLITNALILLLFLLLTLIPLRAGSGVGAEPNQQHYPSGSWALGVVVPEGSQFADRGRLSWENATAVTAIVRLPNISFTDAPTLAVESVMASDGSVLQIAAGMYPNSTSWLAYGWYIGNLQAYPQSYDWVLNSSKPEMSAGASVSLSIYLSLGKWHYRIEDISTNETVSGEYALAVSPAVKVGDQEVFALESYSTSNGVFANMGNLTLDTLSINGRRVSGGWYLYGSWDMSHKPLFVVGGLEPPFYISLQQSGSTTFTWSYNEWETPEQPTPQTPVLPFLIAGLTLVAIVIPLVVYEKKKHKPDSS
ncbi:MAG: hypothetical protein ACLP5V_14955 [Candidatus Bathyarchaeia archaeon]